MKVQQLVTKPSISNQEQSNNASSEKNKIMAVTLPFGILMHKQKTEKKEVGILPFRTSVRRSL